MLDLTLKATENMVLRLEVSPYLMRHMRNSDLSHVLEIEFSEGVTVQQLIMDLGIRLEEVGVVTVNRCVVSMKDLLNEGDFVGVFPSALGG